MSKKMKRNKLAMMISFVMALVVTITAIPVIASTPNEADILITVYGDGGYEEIVAHNWTGTVSLNTETYVTVRNFLNVDPGNLRVSSDSNNPGRIYLELVRDSDESVIRRASVEPGRTVTMNVPFVTIHRRYTVRARAATAGLHGIGLSW